MEKILNQEQSRLVEKHHNLIYDFLKKRGLYDDDSEDWYGVSALGLCKAAMAFDPSREIKFSVLAFVCMENEVRQVKRKLRQQIRDLDSLEQMCYVSDGNASCTLLDRIADPSDFTEDVAISIAIDDSLASSTNKKREIIELFFMHNWKQEKIAHKYGISTSYVSHIVNAFSKSVKSNLNITDCQHNNIELAHVH